MRIFAIDRGGRIFYIFARWDDQRAQFTSTDVPAEIARHTTGFQYAYARTLEGLVAAGVRTYGTLKAARERT
jgi:hypothetical protein